MLRSFAILATATLAIPAGQVAADTPVGALLVPMVEGIGEADSDEHGRTGQTGVAAPGPTAGHGDVSDLRRRFNQVLEERLGNHRDAEPSGNSASFRLFLAEYYVCGARASAAMLGRTVTIQCIAIYQAVKSHFLSVEEWNALRADPLGFGGEQGRLAYLRFAAWEAQNADAVACMKAAARATVADHPAPAREHAPIPSADREVRTHQGAGADRRPCSLGL